ncbi:MAG: hypothetical protein AAGA68_20190 [Pseudomonadota bacterium]
MPSIEDTVWTRASITLLLSASLFVACTPRGDSDIEHLSLAGNWQATGVLLIRGELTERYAFTVRLEDSLTEGTLDIRYRADDTPAAERVIRQDLTPRVDPEGRTVVLRGTAPRLLSGPQIEGVYAPDTFTCALNTADQDQLPCLWGSDAQADTVRFILRRMP